MALTLIDEAQEAAGTTLISVGSRGLGGIQRARVGSVSTRVVRVADGPIPIYPQTREQENPAAETPKVPSFWSKQFDDRYRSGRRG